MTEVKIGKDDDNSMVIQADSLGKEIHMYKTDEEAANNNYDNNLSYMLICMQRFVTSGQTLINKASVNKASHLSSTKSKWKY